MTLAEKFKAALAKINTAIAQSGFNVQVTGGDKLSLDLAGVKIEQPDDFYVSGYVRPDGTYNIMASLYMDKPGIDGFHEKVRLEYDPNSDSNDFAMQPVEAATAKVATPRELQAKIDTLTEEVATRKDFVSPTDMQTKIDAAVAEAKAAALPAGDDTAAMTQDDVNKQIDAAMAERDAIELAMTTRSESLVADGFTLTEERKTMLATFTADAAGDTAFTDWIKNLKVEQASMLKVLDEKGIETTDALKSAVACLNNKADSGFTALIASHSTPAQEQTFSPSLTSAIGSSDAGETPGKGMC